MRLHQSGSAVTLRSGRQNLNGGAPHPHPRAVLCRRGFGVLTGTSASKLDRKEREGRESRPGKSHKGPGVGAPVPAPPPTACHTRTCLSLPWGARPPLSARHSNKTSWFFVPPSGSFVGSLVPGSMTRYPPAASAALPGTPRALDGGRSRRSDTVLTDKRWPLTLPAGPRDSCSGPCCGGSLSPRTT